ncbi:MAG: hypothetical protein C4576_12235 [Desulfobacteraceae bacterium]|nr:MAG: hypothetical protein C4576_12235 [Desulfobacteraceae bacterium]
MLPRQEGKGKHGFIECRKTWSPGPDEKPMARPEKGILEGSFTIPCRIDYDEIFLSRSEGKYIFELMKETSNGHGT